MYAGSAGIRPLDQPFSCRFSKSLKEYKDNKTRAYSGKAEAIQGALIGNGAGAGDPHDMNSC